MKKFTALLCAAALAASCATVDFGKKVGGAARGKNSAPAAPVIFPEPEIVVVERDRPVFIPEKDAPGRPAEAGTRAVGESNRDGIVKPLDYSHAAMLYDYNPDLVYEIYAQPLRVCDIHLEPGERALEPPFISDSERWILGAGVSYSGGTPVQHIYVKPASSGLEASLIVNTDRRVYHIILRSYKDVYMPIVRWRYSSGAPANYLPSPLAAETGGGGSLSVDPRFLSFNYRVTYSVFKKPVWLPELVFDDGAKTYIAFPDLVLQRELPSVFENRKDILNYRVSGNLIIIDKLIENITVKIERTEITVAKKRG